jgi:hypothetical protein
MTEGFYRSYDANARVAALATLENAVQFVKMTSTVCPADPDK